jgi:capsular polysaccharide biosynthesis protein
MASSSLCFPQGGTRTTVPPAQRLHSPSFPVRYPKIISPHLLDPGARGAMEVSWSRERFEERALEVFVLRDVYVSEECLVFDNQLRVIENASDPYSEAEIAEAIEGIIRLLGQQTLPHFRSGVLSKRRAAGNYGHFLIEMLPMALIGRGFLVDPDPWYLVHLVGPALQDAVFRAFRLLGVALDRLLVKDFHQPVHFEELVVVRGLTQHGTYMSPLTVRTVETMSRVVPAGPYKKIFIRRVPGWNRGRALVNETEVLERLTARGFHALEPGSLSLEEQIAAFRGADHVVGVAGAAMTNIAFCRAGTKVTLLFPGSFPDTFFWFIATHKLLDYAEIRCETTGVEGPDQWKADFRLTASDLAHIAARDDEIPVSALSDAGTEPAAATAEVKAHIGGTGDIAGRLGDWIGKPGSGTAIEGFGIYLRDNLQPEEIEYCAVLEGWLTPWIKGGVFCGTRGWSLPLFGLAVRLRGVTAQRYVCSYAATFTDGTTWQGANGAVCRSRTGAPLEAFQLLLPLNRTGFAGG